MSENGRQTGTFRVKSGMAQMLKGGVIMDVVDAEQAKIAEESGAGAGGGRGRAGRGAAERRRVAGGGGAVGVRALGRLPADIGADGGVARMSDPEMISGIQEAVSIPVMAKARIGHFAEAQGARSEER